jgi:gluconate kinase
VIGTPLLFKCFGKSRNYPDLTREPKRKIKFLFVKNKKQRVKEKQRKKKKNQFFK